MNFLLTLKNGKNNRLKMAETWDKCWILKAQCVSLKKYQLQKLFLQLFLLISVFCRYIRKTATTSGIANSNFIQTHLQLEQSIKNHA